MSIIYNYKDAPVDDWVFSYDKILDVVTPNCDARWEAANCSIGVNNSNLHCTDPSCTKKRDIFIDESASFFHNRTTVMKFSSLTKKYGLSFYWSALTLTTLGEQAAPRYTPQFLFETLDTLLGLIIFAVIVGDVGAMVSSMNLVRTMYEEKLDGCKRYMNFRKVHPLLVRKIVHWYEYSWKEGSAKVDESTIAESLPSRLHGQLAVHIHMDTLKKVALFQDCEPTLLYELVLKLQLQLFSPGDYVCRKGDIGKELYIIRKGKLDVVSEDGKQVFVTLKEGSVFGELSVLNIRGNKNGNRRTASIRSVGYSDLYSLTKGDLWEVLREYPEDKKSLIEKGKSILRKDNLLIEDGSIDSDDELDDHSTLEQRLEYIAKQVSKTTVQLDKYERQFLQISEHF
uniref:Cyclic nucleotide-binding domain-containing protein n=1 Tax=Panagrolaimus sp. ES5 TaxID=591445 RepID=A0AC34F2X9_9BILA